MTKKQSSRFLVLFDIDGTLISAGRSGYNALDQAIREVLGSAPGLTGIRLDGNTDSKAIREICTRDRRPLPDADCLSRFKAHYIKELQNGIVGKGHVKPGIPSLLKRLTDRSDVVLGLVTGNFREGAEIKLRHFGLWDFFGFGAFGCEDPERSRLIGLAIDRARQNAGDDFPPECITMIGDTIHDVTACHPWGIKSLAVCTGSTSHAELLQVCPTWVLPDLADTENVVSLLTNPSRQV